MIYKKLGLLLATCLTVALASTSFAAAPIQDPAQAGLAKDLIYFVFPDRYLNGDTSNDKLPGYDPTDTAFFHGGDLKGLTGTCSAGDNGLARIKKLGFTAVWVTPLVVQQKSTPGGAGYHGYWGVDFLNVDPHLGTKADLIAFSECAKKLGLKLILDVVTNHTGDVIKYNDKVAYIPADSTNAKNPQWLNDLSNFHNVGDMSNCWGDGSCTQLGDFYGLDDTATEKPVVYNGWAQVYGQWIKDYGFVGFRVDTARHVDDNFFKNWSPQINAQAASVGINNFTTFGEVWDVNPINLMNYVRRNKLQTVLDFPFQRTSTEFASGYSDASTVANLFSYDDLYTSATSSASNLVTFLGNHDMGRAGKIIESKRINPAAELLPRTLLGHALLYLTRGIPSVYYGDEVGMTGTGSGSDQLARQDMFSTKVKIWKTEKRIGSSPIGTGDSFTVTDKHPIALYLEKLAALRAGNPGLANGSMQIRIAKDSLLVISKKDDAENREYIVAFNNSTKPIKTTISTATSAGGWKSLLGTSTIGISNEKVTVTVPALSTLVLKANKGIDKTAVKVGKITSAMDFLTGYYETKAALISQDLLRVTFYCRTSADQPWTSLGTDTNAPYSVYIDPLDYEGKKLEIRADAVNSKGVKYELPSTTITVPAP
ncbi:MAG: alpha-amylase family glycosyl hydrolase [Actinomycetes bacterium]